MICCCCCCSTVAGLGGVLWGCVAVDVSGFWSRCLARRADHASRSLFCCSLINFCKRFNEQCLTSFFFPPMSTPFTLRFGQGQCGPGAGGGVVCLAISHMIGSGSRGGVLFLVCCLWTRLLVHSVVGYVGFVVLVCVVVVCLSTL